MIYKDRDCGQTNAVWYIIHHAVSKHLRAWKETVRMRMLKEQGLRCEQLGCRSWRNSLPNKDRKVSRKSIHNDDRICRKVLFHSQRSQVVLVLRVEGCPLKLLC